MFSPNFKNLIIAFLSGFIVVLTPNEVAKICFIFIASFHLGEYFVVAYMRRKITKVIFDEENMSPQVKEKMDAFREAVRDELDRTGETMFPPCNDPTCIACRIRKSKQN